MQTKESYKGILEKETNRVSPFLDLDHSMRSGYKILLDVRNLIS